MIDLNIKNDEEKVTAEYLLKSNDRIDNLTLGMMVNNDIEGFLPVQPVQVENDRYFRYDITGLVTMKEYLGEYVKKDRLLKVFYGIANTIRESSEYMINWTSFSLERKEIYVNPENGDVRLLCLPLLTVINDGNICNFFKNVLFSSQFDLDENGDYVGKLITFLNPKSYTLDKFIYELEDMLGLEYKEVVEEEDEEDTTVEAETEEDKSDADVEKEPAEDTKQEVANDDDTEIQPELEENIAETSDEVIDEKVTEETIEIDEVSGKDAETEEVPPTVSKPEIEPYLIRLSNNQEIKIDKDSFYIGKDEKNVDYCISDNLAIDDKHAYIIRHGKEYFVVDNNSKNHTYLNRVLIGTDEEVFIPHGAQLRFADEDFEFRMHK